MVMDGYMGEATGLISWKDLHTACQDASDEKQRASGAAAAAAAAAPPDANMGVR